MHPLTSTKSSLQLILLCFLGVNLVPGSSAKDYWDAGLKKHNEYRAAHNTPLLELDTELAEIADKCAEYYAAKDKIDHSCPYGKSGENLYWHSSKKDLPIEGVVDATIAWYDEIKDYDFEKHKTKEGGVAGHFTQVVWKGSKKLGMGYKVTDKGTFVVGLYTPAGNYVGEDEGNVLPPINGAGRSSNSSASIPSTLIRGQKGCGAISLTLVMSVGVVAGVIN